MKTLSLFAVLLLASCGGDRCDSELLSVDPEVGSANVSRSTPVVFELDEVSGDETVTLTVDGEVVPGSTTIDGSLVVFQPDAELLPDTRYEAAIDGPCGHFTAFTTAASSSGGGDPVDDPEELVGATYVIDLDDLDSVEPDLLSLPLSNVEEDLALGVEDIQGNELHALLTMTLEPGVQDLCVATTELPAASWNNPSFALQSVVPVPLGDGGVAFNEFSLSGRFAADGSYIQNATIEAQIDLRGAVDDPAATCFALAFAGTPCVDCVDGTPLCVDVVMRANRAERVDGWTLVPRTAEQIAGDPACN